MIQHADEITLAARERLIVEQRERLSKILSDIRHAGDGGTSLRALTRQHHASASEILSVLVFLAARYLIDLRFGHGTAKNGSSTKKRWIATAVAPLDRDLAHVDLPLTPIALAVAKVWVPILINDRKMVNSVDWKIARYSPLVQRRELLLHLQREQRVAPALAQLAAEHLRLLPYGKFDPSEYMAQQDRSRNERRITQ